MTTQPEVLRLADALEMSSNHGIRREAAAELRRLHAECNDLAHQLNESNERNGRIIAQRDALLEALKTLVLATKDFSVGHYNEEVHDIALSKSRAAIKQAEEKA